MRIAALAARLHRNGIEARTASGEYGVAIATRWRSTWCIAWIWNWVREDTAHQLFQRVVVTEALLDHLVDGCGRDHWRAHSLLAMASSASGSRPPGSWTVTSCRIPVNANGAS